MGGGERLGAEEGDRRLAEQVAVGLDLDLGAHRRVGEDEVEGVDAQLGEEALRLVLAADDVDRLGERERGQEQAVGDELGDGVGDPDREADAAAPSAAP